MRDGKAHYEEILWNMLCLYFAKMPPHVVGLDSAVILKFFQWHQWSYTDVNIGMSGESCHVNA